MKLPPNTKRITKVFVSFIGRSEEKPLWGGSFLNYSRALMVGEIGLSVAGTGNPFFRDLVQTTDQNAYYLDSPGRVLPLRVFPESGLAYFPGPQFKVLKPYPLNVPVANILVEGWFQDLFYLVEMIDQPVDVLYNLKVYLWAELDENMHVKKTEDSPPDCEQKVEINSLIVAAVQN